MLTSNSVVENEDSPSKLVGRGNDRLVERANDKSYERTVTTEPKAHSWMIVAAGAVVPIGMAGAALATTYLTQDPQVAMTSWIAVAIVGTASVISSAAVSHRRSVTVDRNDEGKKSQSRMNDSYKSKTD